MNRLVLVAAMALLAGGALGARLWQREARTRLGLPLSRLFGAVGPALVVLVGLAWGLGALDTSIDVARSVAESGGSTSLAARAAPAIRALARGLEREAASPTQGSGAVFLLAVLVAPFIEELFFRGVLFTGLRARLGVGLAAAASAAVFALGHAYQFAGYQVFAVGIVLALAMQRTGTLWTPVLIHAGWNLLLALS